MGDADSKEGTQMTPDEQLASNLDKIAVEFDNRAENMKRSQLMWPAALDAEARARVCRDAAKRIREINHDTR